MKYLSIIKPTSKELVKRFAEKRNLVGYVKENYSYSQEDYLIASDTPPVFVVSDGVTLDFMKLVENNQPYPNPSPAGVVAKIFCEEVVEGVKERYANFNLDSIVEVFKEANNKVGEYNKKIGKTGISGNRTGFYSSTAAFVVVKGGRAYWASICDSFVAHFDGEMNLKFMSTGVCTPYAVVNGEEYMAEHLEKGVFDLEEGDKAFVFTDGFEPYVKNPDFQKLFLNCDDSIQKRISEFSDRVTFEDVEKYGHERSVVVISV